MSNRAICITCGEQSENHVGMFKHGSGLAENGYSIDKLREVQEIFDSMGCATELIDLRETALVGDELIDVEEAAVLVLRNWASLLLNDTYDADDILTNLMKELTSFEWDKTYWDTRRQKWLNKRARYNVCFGNTAQELDTVKKSGTIIAYHSVPMLHLWKTKMQELLNDTNQEWECEGNFYYDAKKTGIGFHGDGERRKVIALNVCDEDVEREINWQWFKNSKPFGKRIRVFLRSGDCYIMSEKATGTDWKKRVKVISKNDGLVKIQLATLRHAAAVSGSKYLKIKGQIL